MVAAGVAGLGLISASPAAAGAWCGSGEPTTDLPDTVNAFTIHVVYALPSGAADRFADVAAQAVTDTAAISSWWRGQDPTRTPRFDLFAADCPEDSGRLDVTLLHLPYAAGTGSGFAGIISAMQVAGLDSPDKGYLIYVDDKSGESDASGEVCGTSNVDPPAIGYAVVYLQSCSVEGDDGTRQMVIAHELVHAMGAVLPSAPHYCDDGHVCDDPTDLMAPSFPPGTTLDTRILDVGHDDYYEHPGAWWDVRDSVLLARLDSTEPAPPAIVGLTATNTDTVVALDWSKTAATASGDTKYRIYGADGQLRDQPQSSSTYTTLGTFGETIQFTVRSSNAAGLLSPPATIRLKVGYGIVDANGMLVQDTVAPAAVEGLRAQISRKSKTVVLHWKAVSDPIGLHGYRVTVPGRVSKTVAGTSVSFPAAKVLGRTVTVRTIDEAGNRSLPTALTVWR